MELTEGSETSPNHNLTPGKYPKEHKQKISYSKCLVMFSNLPYSLKHIYVKCLEEMFYALMKDLVAMCEQFNIYIFHELSSNFIILPNADASSLQKPLKMLRFYPMLINVLFQNFFLVFRIAYYTVYMLVTLQIIYISSLLPFSKRFISRFFRPWIMLFRIWITATAFPALTSHNSHSSQSTITYLFNITFNLLYHKNTKLLKN
jgi:hypothetical protein